MKKKYSTAENVPLIYHQTHLPWFPGSLVSEW